MASENQTIDADGPIEVDLREPGFAAMLAWLWPGAGHIYQRRHAKGILFMVCILSTYFFGLALGGGHVVYASWRPHDKRWQYVCQLGVGAPAFPALLQSFRQKPLFGGFMAPPKNVTADNARGNDELAGWHKKYHAGFELGTLYTVIAGLLNVLAIYDAYAGPFAAMPEEESNRPPPENAKRKKKKA